MVELKTAVLYGAAAATAGVLMGADDETVEALYRYGIDSGCAFQIQDDVLDLTVPSEKLGKQRGSDLVENKETLITLHARQQGVDVGDLVAADSVEGVSEAEIDDAVERLRDVGSIEYALQTGQASCERQANLEVLPDNDARYLLEGIANYPSSATTEHGPDRRAVLAGVAGLEGLERRVTRSTTRRSTATVTSTTETVRYTHLQTSGIVTLFESDVFVHVALFGSIILVGLPLILAVIMSTQSTSRSPRGEVRVSRDRVESVVIEPDLPAGQPPAVVVQDNGVRFLTADETGPNTHAVQFPDGTIVTVSEAGAVRVDGDLLIEDALPDARIVWQDDVAAVLAGATERYDHGALGDEVEARAIVLFVATEWDRPPPSSLPEPTVVEGVAPILADIDDDGDPKYSSPSPGPMRALGWSPTDWTASASRLARNRDGLSLAPPALCRAVLPRRGARNRRRSHPAHRRDGGVLPYRRRPALNAARYDGVSSHAFGSVASTVDSPENARRWPTDAAVPTQERRKLVALQRQDGVRQAAQRDIGASLASNVAATPTDDGGLACRRSRDGVVRVWQSGSY